MCVLFQNPAVCLVHRGYEIHISEGTKKRMNNDSDDLVVPLLVIDLRISNASLEDTEAGNIFSNNSV